MTPEAVRIVTEYLEENDLDSELLVRLGVAGELDAEPDRDVADIKWSRPPVLVYEGDTLILLAGGRTWSYRVDGVRRSLTNEELILEVAPSDVPSPASTPGVLAQRFHETYERLAPEFGYRTREASAVPWKDVPAENKALMIAVCAEILAG